MAILRVFLITTLFICLSGLSGCGSTNEADMGNFERQVNASHNAEEMSRSRSDPGYVPRYETTTLAP